MASPRSSLDNLQDSLRSLETRLTQTSGKDEALSTAMEAVRLCLEGLKLVSTSAEKAALRTQAGAFLSQAEAIKKGERLSSVVARSRVADGRNEAGFRDSDLPSGRRHMRLPAPENNRKLTNKEQVIILRASKLHGAKFPPWQTAPTASLFEVLPANETMLSSQSPLRLSPEQQTHFLQWSRPGHALSEGQVRPEDIATMIPTMASSKSVDLVQDVASDCSVVASLCLIAAREEKGHFSLLPDILYPQDKITGLPKVSPSGLYVARLNFSGSFRTVLLDDRLPESKGGRLLHTVDLNCLNLLWPALLEKAYLKVRGGYDFPGSNTCTDLWTLTGWIPEQIFLEDDETDLQTMWRRIWKAHNYGDVMVSFGTGKLSSQMESALSLASEHSYALIGIHGEDGQQQVLLKNPWRNSSSGLGISSSTSRSAVHNTDEQSNLNRIDDPDTPHESLGAAREGENKGISGTFWMSLDQISQNFESMYLNWNPGLFSHRSDVHFTWTIPDRKGPSTNFTSSPQFSLSSEESTEAWCLLCRHFTESTPKLPTPPSSLPGRMALNDVNAAREALSGSPGYLSLYAFDNQGHRVRNNVKPVKRSHYVDSTQVLLRLPVQQGRSYTLVPSEQEFPSGDHNFSLVAFSTSIISLDHARNPYNHSTRLRSAWNITNAGGNSDSAAFPSNPQFKVSLPRKARIAITLESHDPAINVNVKLLYSGGKRLAKVARQDIVADSGDYRVGVAQLEIETVDAGNYTIICSTFEAGQEGAFEVEVDSTETCTLTALPGEFAGRFRESPGIASFATGVTALAAPLFPKRLIKLTAVAKHRSLGQSTSLTSVQRDRLQNTGSQSPIRISIAIGRGDHAHYLTMSNGGEFDASELGVRTADIDLWPNMKPAHVDLCLVLERLCPSVSDGDIESYIVELLTDGERRKDWDVGEWRSWDF